MIGVLALGVEERLKKNEVVHVSQVYMDCNKIICTIYRTNECTHILNTQL